MTKKAERFLSVLRHGNLTIRRWRKRWVLLFISANIWLDQLIAEAMLYGKSVLVYIREKVNEVADFSMDTVLGNFVVRKELAQFVDFDGIDLELAHGIDLVDLLTILLLVFSIFFWFSIASSLSFVAADYYYTKKERGRRQYFILFVILVNLMVYFFLNEFDWYELIQR